MSSFAPLRAILVGVLAAGFVACAASPALAGSTSILSTTIDPLLKDTAVTDAQLATAGVVDDGGTVLNSSGNVLLVDDDNKQCPQAQYHSINEAILAAPAGATIRVCPGTYNESRVNPQTLLDEPGVFVVKPLLIQAVRLYGSPCGCHVSTYHDPTQEAITNSWAVEADNATVDGFTVVADLQQAIEVDGVNDRVRHNVIDGQDRAFGVNFGLTAHGATIDHNCLRRVADGIDDVSLGGNKVQSNQIVLSKTAAGIGINLNTFAFPPLVATSSDVSHNTIVGAGIGDFGIFVGSSNSATVSYNSVTGSTDGIVLDGDGTGSLSVTYNVLRCGAENGITTGGAAITKAVISNNSVAGYGINGIYIGPFSSFNTVSGNRSTSNGSAGIDAELGSLENSITNNTMTANGTWDCQDDSAGTHNGPAMTANQWTGDFGFTENRPGLCHHS